MTRELPYDIETILELLPHRYPFLLIDRVIEFEAEKRLVATKNITINEPCFTGHFPHHPVFPGVLIIEALAQASGVLLMEMSDDPDILYYLANVDKARFRRTVVPGDQLRLEVELIKLRQGFAKFNAIAKVDNHVVCSAELINAKRP